MSHFRRKQTHECLARNPVTFESEFVRAPCLQPPPCPTLLPFKTFGTCHFNLMSGLNPNSDLANSFRVEQGFEDTLRRHLCVFKQNSSPLCVLFMRSGDTGHVWSEGQSFAVVVI